MHKLEAISNTRTEQAAIWPLLLIALLLGIARPAQALSHGKAKVSDETTTEINDALSVVDLRGIWFFHDGDEPMFARTQFDDRSWTPKRVPTDRNSWDKRWQGYGWYRRHIYVGSQALGQELMLSLGPAREVVDVYLNGVLLMQRGRFGSRLHGDASVLPLQTLIPTNLLQAGENVLAVRVYDPSYACALPAGPLLIGPPKDVLDRVAWRGYVAIASRMGLAMLALCIALGQMLINARRVSAYGEHRWAAAAALALTITPLAGTGVLTATLPSLELAIRLPDVAQALSLVFFLQYFGYRYDDFASRRARAGIIIVSILTAFIFLAPANWVFFVAAPATWVMALLTTLYAAHLLAYAARRQERGALPVFMSLLIQIGLLVYDGLSITNSDVIPPGSVFGAVGVLAMVSVMGARETLHDGRKTLLTMLSLRKELDNRVWMDILQATVNSISRPQEYLDAVAHEIAREMGVRRCSMILPDSRGQLYIVASKGLPKQARHAPLQSTVSIARYVFETGQALTPATMPAELQRKPEDTAMRGNYDTQGFIANPIRINGRTLGVLNVTDLNDGGVFNPGDEAHVASLCDRLGLVLDRLHLTADVVLAALAAAEATTVKPHLIRANEQEEEEAEATKVVPGNVSPAAEHDEPTKVVGANVSPAAENETEPTKVVTAKVVPVVEDESESNTVVAAKGQVEPDLVLDKDTATTKTPFNKTLS